MIYSEVKMIKLFINLTFSNFLRMILMQDNRIEEIVKSLKEASNNIQKTSEKMKQVAQKMRKTKQELLRSMEQTQKNYKELNLIFFHNNSCFSVEERVKQLENNYIIIDQDENLIIHDSL